MRRLMAQVFAIWPWRPITAFTARNPKRATRVTVRRRGVVTLAHSLDDQVGGGPSGEPGLTSTFGAAPGAAVEGGLRRPWRRARSASTGSPVRREWRSSIVPA